MSVPHGRPQGRQPIPGAAQRRTGVTPLPGKGVGGKVVTNVLTPGRQPGRQGAMMGDILRFALAALLLLCLSVLLAGRAAAQSYSASSGAAVAAAYPWIDISASGTTLVPALVDDSASGLINLGFTFTFGATAYTQARIGSNGNLQFASNNTAYTNTQLPLTGAGGEPNINAVMLPLWDDHHPGGVATRIRYQTMGAAPNRVFVVSWLAVPRYCSGGANCAGNQSTVTNSTFQIQVYERGDFVYRYGAVDGSGAAHVTPPNPADPGGTVGYEVSNTDYVEFSYNTAAVPNGTTILWTRVNHYAVSGTTAGTICAPSTVTITAHNPTHGAVNPSAGTVLTLTTSTGSGQWGALVAGGGTWTPSGLNNGQASYVWPGGESSVTLQIDHTTAATLGINLSDSNARTEAGTEDPNFTFAAGCVGHYALTGTTSGTICSPSTVTITAHNSGHTTLNPAAGTTLTLTTSTGTGQWDGAVVSGGGTWTSSGLNNGQATYVWPGGENSVTLQLNHSTAATLSVNLSDNNAKTETGAEDPNFSFAAGCVAHYALSGTTAGTICDPSLVTITAHEPSHALVTPSAGRTLTLTTSTGTGLWGATVVAGGGTWTPSGLNNGQATYAWSGSSNTVTLRLSHATATTLSVNMVDSGGKIESAAEDPNFVFGASCVAHYALTGTTAGLTCAPSTVTITAHNPAHAATNAATATVLTLSTSTGSGQWGASVVSGGGTWAPSGSNNGQATYTWPGGENSVTLQLNDAAVETLSINLADGNGKAESEDPSFSFTSAGCVNHYSISGQTAGVTCEPSQVTITAHTSGHATVDPTLGTTLTLATSTASGVWQGPVTGAGVFTPSGLNNGSATYAWPGGENTVTLYLGQTSPTTLSVNLADNNGKIESEDPAFTFSDAGFRVASNGTTAASIGTQIAGKDSNVGFGAETRYLQAIKKSPDTAGCTVAFQNRTVVVDLASRCENPLACVPASRLAVRDSFGAMVPIANNNGGPTPASYTGVSLAFDAESKAPLVHNFPDAGQIMLFARFLLPPPPAANYMAGSSNAFVVRPFGLALRGANAATAVQHGTTDSSALLAAAGDNFTMTVAGYRWAGGEDADNDGVPDAGINLADNGLTPNFAWATTVSATANLPGIATGAITRQSTGTGTVAPAEFAGGAATVADWRYSEAGNVFLAASASNYITAGISVTGNSGHDGSGAAGGYVGRFRPKHFRIDGVVAPALANRAALLPCVSSHTYLGENLRLSFRLLAQNAQDVLTQNYSGAYAKLNPASTAVYGLGARSGATNLTPRVSSLYPGATPAWASGLLDIPTGNPLHVAVARAASPDGPYPGTQFGIAPVDSDAVAMASHDLDVDGVGGNDHAMVAGTTELRFGRLKFFNAFGSELLPLPLRYETQYYDSAASGFKTNSADNCTSISGRVGADNYVYKQGSGPWTPTITVGGLAAGRGTLTLSPPGAGRSVRLDIAANLGSAAAVPTSCRPLSLSVAGGAALSYLRNICTGTSYDKDPIGNVVFGVHKNADAFIFMREMY